MKLFLLKKIEKCWRAYGSVVGIWETYIQSAQIELWLNKGEESELVLTQLNSYMRRLVRQEMGKK
jgi:hypothetical protein